jgi:Surface lipoprotein assembly modifier
MVSQSCEPGHNFAGLVGASIGSDSNARPPSVVIRPNNHGPGGGGVGGGMGGMGGMGAGGAIQQPLVETTTSDTLATANASLRHGYCLTDSDAAVVVLWDTHAAVLEKHYLEVDGADEQSLSLATGAVIAGNWLWQVQPLLEADESYLDGNEYRQSLGVSSQQLWNISNNWQAGFRVAAGRVEFDQVPDTLHVEGHDRSLSVETSYLFSPLYRMKLGAGHAVLDTDDPKLSNDGNSVQAEFSRRHPWNCDAHIRYSQTREDYDYVTTSGAVRSDDVKTYEVGACARFSPQLMSSLSLSHTRSDSNEVEFEYTQNQINLALEYQY